MTLFLARGARIAVGNAPDWWWTPVSTATSSLFGWMSQGWQRASMWTLQWIHMAIILGFLVYLGYSKHLHIATSAINVYFASTRPRGTLTPLRIDLENAEAEDVHLGATTVTDLTWKQTLDLYACTECGRCQSVPRVEHRQTPLAQAPGHEPARPPVRARAPDLGGQGGRCGTEPVPLVPDVIDEEVLWACTTCGACMQECPVDIEHVDTIVDMRRNLVMGESRFPAEAGAMLRNLETAGNPWGMPQAQQATGRRDWTSR